MIMSLFPVSLGLHRTVYIERLLKSTGRLFRELFMSSKKRVIYHKVINRLIHNNMKKSRFITSIANVIDSAREAKLFRSFLRAICLAETVQLILSILIAICSAGMLYASLDTPSPMKWLPISVFVFILVGSIALVIMSYYEFKEALV